MQKDHRLIASALAIQISKKHAYPKGIKELAEILMKKSKGYR